MTDIPNCSNCPQHCDLYETGKHTRRQLMQCFTEACGCLSHHGAREYLMKDVIEELEQAKRDNELGWKLYVRDHLEKAIALIKEGVKK